MSADRVERDLICRLLAELVEVDPPRVRKILKRFQFKMGDVSFMVTEKGHFWTEVWRWPWDEKDYVAAVDDEPALEASSSGSRDVAPQTPRRARARTLPAVSSSMLVDRLSR